MYKNSKYTVLFPLLLAAGVVLGLLLGQYMGRNSTTSEIKGMLRQMALPTNKLTYTLSASSRSMTRSSRGRNSRSATW